jgi:hypothetical protein
MEVENQRTAAKGRSPESDVRLNGRTASIALLIIVLFWLSILGGSIFFTQNPVLSFYGEDGVC